LVPLGRGQLVGPLTAVCLVLPHPVTQCLRVHAQVPRDVSQRPVRLLRQPDRPIPQLLRVLPRSSHSRSSLPPGRSSWYQGLHPTRGGSTIGGWRFVFVFVFYGRISTAEFQDPASSRRWQLDSALDVTTGHGMIIGEYVDIRCSRRLPWDKRPQSAA